MPCRKLLDTTPPLELLKWNTPTVSSHTFSPFSLFSFSSLVYFIVFLLELLKCNTSKQVYIILCALWPTPFSTPKRRKKISTEKKKGPALPIFSTKRKLCSALQSSVLKREEKNLKPRVKESIPKHSSLADLQRVGADHKEPNVREGVLQFRANPGS